MPMRLPTLGRRIHILTLAATSVIVAGSAHADPIQIATVQAVWSRAPEGLTTVDLGANPSAVLAGAPVSHDDGSVRAHVSFFTILAARQAGILRASFDWPEGWAPPFSFLVQQGPVDGADMIVFGMDFPIVYHPVPVELTLSVPGVPGGGIIGPSTFTFSVVQPVPEPTSIALWGTGLVAAMLVRRRRRV
jgi:hypothetical protein